MAYTPINQGIYSLFVIYLLLIAAGIYLTIKMISKWRERKVKSPLYLSFVFIAFFFALLFLAIGALETIITGYFKEIYRITFPLSYCSVVVADIFLYNFAMEITGKGKKGFIPIIILGIIIIILLLLPWNWWGFPREVYEGKLNIRTYSTIIFAIYSITIYSIIASISWKAKTQAEEKVLEKGLLFLFLGVISMIVFFVMISIDNILIVVFSHPGYSIFVYLGWVFAFLFILFLYLSLAMPKWIKNRLKP
ncbi:MAG: hypothetical protein GF311_22915 [Candidatus Lokiarchaeota archaeon]|nr:hypothetical protein [Candidatus Lokiarchaeota archaeon]